MPPTNSPSDTRSSTPPPYALASSNSSLSSHPYLQQLEEAISTPVPDLASTLTTPESRPASERRIIQSTASEAWDGRTVLHTSRVDDADQQSLRDPVERPSSTEAISRMQSELDRWQTERNRLRSILHNQQNRQSMLEEQNFRLREQRSRLQEEHTRLYEQSSRVPDRNSHSRPDLNSLRQAQNNLSNLAGAISEVGRDSYATTGAGPSRQSLYDWAATRDHGRLNGGVEDEEIHSANPAEATPRDLDSVPRRELERALRNYRMARNAFRSGRQPGIDLGAVPTASALRAYWSEEPQDVPSTYRAEESSSSRTPFALSEFVEQHRVERQRRHLEVIRRQNEQIRNDNQPHSNAHPVLRSNFHTSDSFLRVRNTIKYLSALRYTHPQSSLDLARSLGLNSLHEPADSTVPSYLPLHVESLPVPQPSSWLTSGMTWHGLQSTDREPSRPPIPTRRQRREPLGVSMARSRLADSRLASSLLPSEFIPSQSPLDTDRYMSSLMRDSEGRWGFNDEPEHNDVPGLSTLDPLATHQSVSTSNATPTDVDHWPVTVTLHSVDFDTMTVAGTMRASQLPDKMISTHSTPYRVDDTVTLNQGLKSMESYFQGEIIDFRQHTLETEGDGQRYRYKSGGVDVDARYWARLGPFKSEIERYSSVCAGVNGKVWDIKTKAGGKYLDSSSVMGSIGGAGAEDSEAEADEVMARCLGDERWLEEKLGRKSGEWVLMRWKEKCFVDPIITTSPSAPSTPNPNHPPSSTTPTTPPTTTTTSSNTTTPRALPQTNPHNDPFASSSHRRTISDSHSATWGLTISGFYYIALNRITGDIDGLYFDPGSQPFQSLRMMPGSGNGANAVKLSSTGAGEESSGASGDTPGHRDSGSEAPLGLGLGLGVRRFFPAVEFR